MAIQSAFLRTPLLVRETAKGDERWTWSRSRSASHSHSDSSPQQPYRVIVTGRFLAFCFITTMVLCFCVGRICRFIVLNNTLQQSSFVEEALSEDLNGASLPAPVATPVASPSKRMPDNTYTSKQFDAGIIAKSDSCLPHRRLTSDEALLPAPVVPPGKRIPHNTFTSKHFDTGLTTKSDWCLIRRRPDSDNEDESPTESPTYGISSHESPTSFAVQIAEEEIHRPTGEHLLVDIENVDEAFLNSEVRLAQAMVTLIEKSGLTLLSYHCHALEPMGVSCVGILLESHVSFHTWPVEGVITLDLFTCGSKQILPLLPEIEKLFAIPKQVGEEKGGAVERPHMQWAHKHRGFRDESRTDSEDVDLGWMNYKLKTHVASVETDFHTMDIIDAIDPRSRRLEAYKKPLSNDKSYDSQHPELYQAERMLYLDKMLQSRLRGEAAYHEALVHPAMFAHDEPRRVAIIGFGAGAALREVLKHNTVKKVTMFEIDEDLVTASKVYLPEWSDCSNLVGSAASCFDDSRAEVYYTDAIAWFIDHFGKSKEFDEADRYDVVIMDSAPGSVMELSNHLQDFMGALYNSLTGSGVFVTKYAKRSLADDDFLDLLVNAGFEKIIKDYSDEGHGGFRGVRDYLIAFKDGESNKSRYDNEAIVNLEIQARILPTVSGESPLRSFDGASMMS